MDTRVRRVVGVLVPARYDTITAELFELFNERFSWTSEEQGYLSIVGGDARDQPGESRQRAAAEPRVNGNAPARRA